MGFERSKPDAYVKHWSVALGTRLGRFGSAEGSYVGNHGVHLRRQINVNLFDPALGRRPLPAFSNINIEAASANSVYHGFHLSWIQRISRGPQFTSAYALGHAIDDVQDQALFPGTPQDLRNLRAERGNSSQDARHIASFAVSYDAPFGTRPGVHGTLLRGWNFSAIGIARSGVAMTVLLGANTFGDGNFVNQRPDAVLNVSPYPTSRSASGWLNPRAFSRPAAGTFGNLGRNTVYGPALAQFDVALTRTVGLTERIKLLTRIEVFNFLNHPNFAQPNNTFGIRLSEESSARWAERSVSEHRAAFSYPCE